MRDILWGENVWWRQLGGLFPVPLFSSVVHAGRIPTLLTLAVMLTACSDQPAPGEGQAQAGLVSQATSSLAVEVAQPQPVASCDPTSVTLKVLGETLFFGSSRAFMEQYAHGQVMFGNRPDRQAFKLAEYIRQSSAKDVAEVYIQACRDKDLLLTREQVLREGQGDWVVSTRTGELRLFSWESGLKAPNKDFKRIVLIEMR